MKWRKVFWMLPILILLVSCSSLLPIHLSEEKVMDETTVEMNPPLDYEGLDYHPQEVLLRLKPGTHRQDLASSLRSVLLQDWDTIGWALFRLPAGETVASFLEKAIAHDAVIYGQPNLQMDFIEPVPDLRRVDSGFKPLEEDTFSIGAQWYEQRLWGMQDIRANVAWEKGHTGSEKVIVAVVDTGVKMDHQAFADNTFLHPYNATRDGSKKGASDSHGHGTHVAGIAVNNGRTGRLAGVSWDSPIMPIRAMDSEGDIWTTYLISAMNYLGDYAKENPEYRIVTNMSIGGRGYNIAFKDAIDYALEQGVLLVTSAGNEYKRVISFPSSYNGVVTVAATTPQRVKADFSTTGWWNSVAAPGTIIWSAITGEQEYAAWQGTSMASPHVAGAVALLLSKRPDLTPLEIKNQLEQTAHPGADGGGFTEELGYGIIDVVDLLGQLEPMQYGSLQVNSNVEYAIVTVFDDWGNLVAFGATGKHEDHKFYALKPGSYTVLLSYSGLTYQKRNVVISRGQKTVVELDVDEEETAQVTFLVLDEEKTPVSGATVDLSGEFYQETKRTGSCGQVEFLVPLGEFSYEVKKKDYLSVEDSTMVTGDVTIEVILQQEEGDFLHSGDKNSY